MTDSCQALYVTPSDAVSPGYTSDIVNSRQSSQWKQDMLILLTLEANDCVQCRDWVKVHLIQSRYAPNLPATRQKPNGRCGCWTRDQEVMRSWVRKLIIQKRHTPFPDPLSPKPKDRLWIEEPARTSESVRERWRLRKPASGRQSSGHLHSSERHSQLAAQSDKVSSWWAWKAYREQAAKDDESL